jgi:hypothetical protein
VKKHLHIARNGQVIGQFESDKIGHLLETGRLLLTDHYYDEGSATWILLSQWKEPEIRARKSESIEPRPESRTNGHRPRGKSKKKAESHGLGGWIACIFAICAVAGLWIWSQTLNDQLNFLKDENTTLKTDRDSLRKANDALNEITPSGSIRGIIVYEPAPNQTAIVSGATVGLYRRQEVETAVNSLKADASLSFSEKIDRLKSILPSPLAVTLTDSNGRLSLAVPDPGDYAIVASAAKGSGQDIVHLLWLAGFKSENRPSPMVLLDEKNAISENSTALQIRNVPPVVPVQ